MRIGIVKERHPGERRVAASSDTVKRYVGMGLEVRIETGAGTTAAVPDAVYEAAGATIVKTAKEALADADVVLKVRKPSTDEIPLLKKGAVVIALMEPYRDRALLETLAAQGVTAFSLEMVPRITRRSRWTCCPRNRIWPAIARCWTPPPSSAAPSR